MSVSAVAMLASLSPVRSRAAQKYTMQTVSISPSDQQGNGSVLGISVTSAGRKQPPSVRCVPAPFASSIGKGCSSSPNWMGVCLVLSMTPVGPTRLNLGRSVSMCLPQDRCLQAQALTWQSSHQEELLRCPRCRTSHLLIPARHWHCPKKLWQGLVRGQRCLRDLLTELTPGPSLQRGPGTLLGRGPNPKPWFPARSHWTGPLQWQDQDPNYLTNPLQ